MEQRTKPYLLEYKKMIEIVNQWPELPFDYFPQIVPDWDNSARAGVKSLVLTGSTPELWAAHVESAYEYVQRYEGDKKLVFIKSWNEWAEGNYLEPDSKWGTRYLEILREVVKKLPNSPSNSTVT
ncbi:MAG: glycoside hydrolase family 99-like domain-containing protein [Ferruginibacter sp.]|nr:glycoside hydrolase family 99-like domain-containing protein [Ferruginibacter sp.]